MAGKNDTLKKNMLFQAIYEMLILILPLVTSPYIARVIGAEGLGIYSYTYSVAYYFVIFANLGLQNYGNRAIAKCRDNEVEKCKTFSEIFIIHTVTTVVSVVLYTIYLVNVKENKLCAFIQVLYIVGAIFDISWFYFGIEKFDYTVLINSLTKVLTVILIFILVKGKDDLPIYCMILGIGTLSSQVALWLPIKRYVHFVRVSMNGIVQHIKPLIILFIPAIAVSLYKYMDKIMLGELSTKVELGFYDNAEKMINIPSTIISAVGTVMLPRMSKLASYGNEEESKKYIDISMRYVMMVAFGLAFGLASIANNFSIIFWGEEFAKCSILIKGLSMSIPFFAFANILRTQYLIPHEKDREYLASIIAGAIMNLLVNCILIPRTEAIGAVIGTVMAEGTVCVIQAYYTLTKLPVKRYILESIPFLLSGFIMSLTVNWIGNEWGYSVFSLLMQAIIGAIIYLAMAIVILTKCKDPYLDQLILKMKKENKNV